MRELAEEKLRNQILNTMVDIMDSEYGAALEKCSYAVYQANQNLKRNKPCRF